MSARFLEEPARRTPVAWEGDLCVVGGSCTGVFAAVRAARLGLRVALVEQNVILGGMAAAAQVNEWHSTLDAANEHPVIAGLTAEMLERLRRRDATREFFAEHFGFPVTQFSAAEMALELDQLLREHGIRVFLSARCVGAVREGNRLAATLIEDKSGRRALAAAAFVDASGDGDLLRRAGFAAYQHEALQPVTMQAVMAGLPGDGSQIAAAIHEFADEFRYPRVNSSPWQMSVPGVDALRNVYGPRVSGVDASDGDQLSTALAEGRRLLGALRDMIAKRTGQAPRLVAWPHALGVRDTWHARCLHQLTGSELLEGTPFADVIAQGTYPVDIHHPGGVALRFLDGREHNRRPDNTVLIGRWKPEDAPVSRFYGVPLRALVPESAENLIVAGRLLDADREGFGGVRVMVNMNQTGEAAGVTAALAVQTGTPIREVNAATVRERLNAGGSILAEPLAGQPSGPSSVSSACAAAPAGAVADSAR